MFINHYNTRTQITSTTTAPLAAHAPIGLLYTLNEWKRKFLHAAVNIINKIAHFSPYKFCDERNNWRLHAPGTKRTTFRLGRLSIDRFEWMQTSKIRKYLVPFVRLAITYSIQINEFDMGLWLFVTSIHYPVLGEQLFCRSSLFPIRFIAFI